MPTGVRYDEIISDQNSANGRRFNGIIKFSLDVWVISRCAVNNVKRKSDVDKFMAACVKAPKRFFSLY